MTAKISADYPFRGRFADVLGSRMHYVEEGEGEPILFLHGNPTWSYLWRNVIPHLSSRGRCIAVDLIGMGRSDKPDIEYRFFDHVRYLESFIERMGLENLTLVVHDWGSALGFHYASRNEANVRGLAFMEAILRPMPGWDVMPHKMQSVFKGFRTKGVGWTMIGLCNMFIERILPAAVVRQLSKEEMEAYRSPYPDAASRKPLWRWPNEIPIAGKPQDVHQAAEDYSRWLQQSGLPKLLLAFQPGAITPPPMVEWCRKNLPNLEIRHLGEGIHYVQEDHPHQIGQSVAEWLGSLGVEK